MDVSKLEPADRDPKKLRNTALLLVLFMVVGGFLILWAYGKYGERTEEDPRPSFLTAITDPEVEMMTADGKVRNLQELKGKVILALTLSTKIQAESTATVNAVREIMAKYKDAEVKPAILVFVLDGLESDPEGMNGILADLGSEPDVWRVAASVDGKSTMRAFMKSKLRFGKYPNEKDGRFDYDTQLILLDTHLQVRGPAEIPIGWDFGKAAGWDAEYEKAKAEHPDKELMVPPVTAAKLTERLLEAIDYIYANPNEKGQK